MILIPIVNNDHWSLGFIYKKYMIFSDPTG